MAISSWSTCHRVGWQAAEPALQNFLVTFLLLISAEGDIDSLMDHLASSPPPDFSLYFVLLGLRDISRWAQCIKYACGLTTGPGWYTLMISLQILLQLIPCGMHSANSWWADVFQVFLCSLTCLKGFYVNHSSQCIFLHFEEISLKCGHQVHIWNI